MIDSEALRRLIGLVHVDIDAFHAYGHAIRHVSIEAARHQLEHFQADHERHVHDLCEAIARHGGDAPSFSRDFRGFILEGFTVIRSMTGTEGALKAMRINETHTNAQYDGADWIDLPDDVREIMMRHRNDEHRHMAYVEQVVEARVWAPEDARSTSNAAGIILPLQIRGLG